MTSWIAWVGAGIAMLPRRSARARWRRFLADTTDAPRPSGRPWLARLRALPMAAPRLTVTAVAVGAGAACLALAGPAAGLVAASYAAITATVSWRRAVRRAETASRRAAMDTVAALAAELRAGQSVGAALAAAAHTLEGPGVVGEDAATIARRVGSAVTLAAETGAPLADVLDRLDVHLRAVDRARETATAQAAGTRASAAMLAAMPVAGAGLGILMGTDPVYVLLHTPLGAGCLATAVVLQLTGLAWSARLSTVDVPV
jgi:tight adherence protein B